MDYIHLNPWRARLASLEDGLEKYDSAVKRDHGEAEARRLIAAALEAWGWDEQSMASLRKGDPQKVTLAWFVRAHTQMPLKWLCEELNLGTVSATSRLLSAVGKHQQSDRNTKKWLRMLKRISKR